MRLKMNIFKDNNYKIKQFNNKCKIKLYLKLDKNINYNKKLQIKKIL